MVEVRVGRLDLHRRERGVPRCLELGELGRAAFGVAELGDGLAAMGAHRAEPEEHDDFARLAGGENQIRLLAADDVVSLSEEIGTPAPRHRLRGRITAVAAEEALARRFNARERRSGKRHPGAMAAGEVLTVETVVRIAGDAKDAVLQRGPGDEERILQVDQVLVGVPQVGEFAVGEHRELSLAL